MNARTSVTPPSVSRSFLAASISPIIAASAVGSRQRTSDRSARSKSSIESQAGGVARTVPTCSTCDRTSMPIARQIALATAPAATRAAVSRALARSSTLRTSSCPYLRTPARSACPGRGSRIGLPRQPYSSSSSGVTGHALIGCVQFL